MQLKVKKTPIYILLDSLNIFGYHDHQFFYNRLIYNTMWFKFIGKVNPFLRRPKKSVDLSSKTIRYFSELENPKDLYRGETTVK